MKQSNYQSRPSINHRATYQVKIIISQIKEKLRLRNSLADHN